MIYFCFLLSSLEVHFLRHIHSRVCHMLFLFDVQTLRCISSNVYVVYPLKLRLANMFLVSVLTLPTINTEGYPSPIGDCFRKTDQRASQPIV